MFLKLTKKVLLSLQQIESLLLMSSWEARYQEKEFTFKLLVFVYKGHYSQSSIFDFFERYAQLL